MKINCTFHLLNPRIRIFTAGFILLSILFCKNANAQQNFTNFQAADLLIGQPLFSSTAASCTKANTNGPSAIAISAKGVTAIAEEGGNRVTIWKRPIVSINQLPDLVLGAPDFTTCITSNTPGASTLRFPSGIAFSPDGKKLLVSDKGNNRILIWNNIPETNNTPADVVIGQNDFNTSISDMTDTNLNGPESIFVDSKGRLFVSDEFNNRVLIWNSIPLTNNAPADVVIGSLNFTESGNQTIINFLGILKSPTDVCVAPNGKLLIADRLHSRILIFNSVPTANGAIADADIGVVEIVSQKALSRPTSITVSSTGQLAIADQNNFRILIFDSIPTTSGASASNVLGQPFFTTRTNLSASNQSVGSVSHVRFDSYGRLIQITTNLSRGMIFGTLPSNQADLIISGKEGDSPSCNPSFRSQIITIKNNGPATATGILVSAATPHSYSYRAHVAGTGSYTAGSGEWKIPTLAAGDSAKLSIQYDVFSQIPATAFLSISHINQLDTNQSDNGFSVEFGPATGTNCIQTGVITPNLCPGTIFKVPFSRIGSFSPGSVFTAELSDQNGGFFNSQVIGTSIGTGNDTIVATIPALVIMGTGYRIRVNCTNPGVSGNPNTADLSIANSSFSTGEATQITANGRFLTASTSPLNLGYEWRRNGSLLNNSSQKIYAPLAGTYTAAHKSNCGTSPLSSGFVFATNSQPQSITFPPIENKVYTDPKFKMGISSSSGLPVSLTFSGPVVISNDSLRIIGVDTVTIIVTQVGNAFFDSAATITQTFVVSKAPQLITVNFIPDQIGYATIPCIVSTSSGLPVSKAMISGFGTIGNTTITVSSPGSRTAQFTQSGNAFFLPAPTVTRTFCVQPEPATSIVGSKTVCKNISSFYGVTAFPNTTISWSVQPDATISPTSNFNSMTIVFPDTGVYVLSARIQGQCGSLSAPTNLTIKVLEFTPIPESVFNMLPSDSIKNLNLPINFSWFPIPKADKYDLFVWKSTSSEPSTPTNADLTSINVSLGSPTLIAGTSYFWKVRAKNSCNSITSTKQSFTTSTLPDLVVNSISVPSSGFSGQPFSVEWQIKNNGAGSTLSRRWIDRIFISTDATLNVGFDVELDAVSNFAALNAGESYTQTKSFVLPNGIQNNYFVFVVTDAYGSVPETNEANNQKISTVSFISLTPPPDLQTTSIITPSFAFSGDQINYTWTIKNLGTGPTNGAVWADRVYLSSNGNGDLSNAMQIGNFTHTGGLTVNQEYITAKTFTLPIGISGRYFLYVVTDASKLIYEHSLENNNTFRSDTIQILLTPPPDLVPVSMANPTQTSNNSSFDFTYSTENQGGADIVSRTWVDIVYASKLPSFDPGASFELAKITRVASIEAGGESSITKRIQIPQNLNGAYFFYVVSDFNNQIFEGPQEGNSVLRSLGSTQVLSPDLEARNIQVAPLDTAGKTIPVSWILKSKGPGALVQRTINERIYLSQNPVFNPATATALKEVSSYFTLINPGDSILRNSTITLPEGISGVWFIYIFTDPLDAIFENGLDANNTAKSNAFQIQVGPTPDLIVSQINPENNVTTAGNTLSVTFTVSNTGSGSTKKSGWKDQLYISAFPTFDSTKSLKIKDFIRSSNLSKDSSYEVSGIIQIPGNLAEGTYFFYVVTDYGNRVFELVSEGNNVGRSNSIFVNGYPPIDLSVEEISLPDSGTSGKAISISWKVKNNGSAPTFIANWRDAVYLSTDPVWSPATDILLTSISRNGSLTAGSSYSKQSNVTLANGLDGVYYLLLIPDYENLNQDANAGNNIKLLKINGDSVRIRVKLAPAVDLKITSATKPDASPAGQPITVSYTVQNQGVGTIGIEIFWTDQLILSTDPVLGNGDDRILASTSVQQVLSPGATYSRTLTGTIPINLSGNYILFLKTDKTDRIYEHLKEDNNVFSGAITFTTQLKSDLIVESVEGPTSAEPGEVITVSWKVKNIGVNVAEGVFKDAAYLSTDSSQNEDDFLISSPSRSVYLPPGNTASFETTKVLAGVPIDKFHILVKTDIQNQILELSDTNNIGISVDRVEISVNDLGLNQLTSRVMTNSRDIFYRLQIPDSLNGESLLLTLKGDSAFGDNEVYIRYNQMPTRANFDFSHGNAFGGNQELIVPELQAGSYYILIGGKKLNGIEQNITLLAEKLNFAIRSVQNNKGGNEGRFTFKVKGAKFSSVTHIKLRKGNRIYTSDTIEIQDATTLFATFIISNADLGLYDVVAINQAGDSAGLAGAFTIETANNMEVAGSIYSPTGLRLDRIVPIRVEFSNPGNTDLINPRLVLRSVGGAPITMDQNGFENAENLTEISFDLKEANGPPAILRPGAVGTILLFAKSTKALSFLLSKD